MPGSNPHRRVDATALLGKRIVKLARVFYEYSGVLEREDGALEVVLENATYLLDSESDGERVRIEEGAWIDPFAPPLSDENQRFVEVHGRWRRTDCSQEQPYAQMIGQTIAAAQPLRNFAGTVVGVRLATPGKDLWFIVDSDECRVYWSPPPNFTEM